MPPASLIQLSPQHLHQRNEGWFPSYKSTSRPCAINPHLNLAATSESSNLHSQPVGSRYGDHPPRPHTNESQLASKATSHLLATIRSLLALCSWAHSLPCDAGSQLQPPQKNPTVAPGLLAPRALRSWEFLSFFLVTIQLTVLGRGFEGNPCPPRTLAARQTNRYPPLQGRTPSLAG